MRSKAGEGGHWMAARIGNSWKPVFSIKEAANLLNYTTSNVRQLCDDGKLIATKEYGRWWVHEQTYKGIDLSIIPF